MPAAILKGGQAWQHLVPLSEQALQLLNGLLVDGKPASEWVFPARNRRGHLGTSAMLDLLGRTGWATGPPTASAPPSRPGRPADQLAREVVELCLSHVQGDPLERAYQRGDILEKRRQLMQAWADYCSNGEQTAANVVPLRA